MSQLTASRKVKSPLSRVDVDLHEGGFALDAVARGLAIHPLSMCRLSRMPLDHLGWGSSGPAGGWSLAPRCPKGV